MQTRLLVRVLGRTSLGLASASLLGCGSGESPAVATAPAAPLSGRYEVTGVTTNQATGEKREIAGTVVLVTSEDGRTYTATFDLDTIYPGAVEALPAAVIGKGEGTIEGRTLRGTSETQLVMATVPGVDPGFAYVPRMVSTRLASTSVANVAPDGSLEVEIRNVAADGEEDYSPTRTTLRGARISAIGVGGE